MKRIKEKFISLGLVLFSSFIGIRLFNEYLKYDDVKIKYDFESSIRVFKDDLKIRVVHPKDYDIGTNGKDTTILVSDSFGEGQKCGNINNISGCLSRLNQEKKIINLSYGGQTPAFYLQQIKKYFSSQKDNRKFISGEKVIVSLYSNDIVLDPLYCDFFESKRSKLKKLMNKNEFDRLNKTCDSLLSLSKQKYKAIKNFRIPFRNQIKNVLGDYSFMLFRELFAQLNLQFSINKSIGRAQYISTWQDHSSGEVILLAEVLDEMVSTCRELNCNLLIATFPNVENLSPDSKVRLSLLSFSKFMKDNYGIKIHDGYEPFISKKIKKATHSLTDIHSSCKGYEIYAKWLADLK